MKKFLLVTNILLLAAIVYLVSGPNAKAIGNTSPREAFKDPECYSNVCLDNAYVPISERDALKIAGNYAGKNDTIQDCLKAIQNSYINVSAQTKDRAKSLNSMIFKDAAAVWYSMDAIKSYICAIERAVCSSGCKDKPKLGIRIYFARYTEGIPDVPGRYIQRHTLFMVPTFESDKRDQHGVNIQYDFNPEVLTRNSCKLTPWDIDSTNASTFLKRNRFLMMLLPKLLPPQPSSTYSTSSGGYAQNHGQLSPPDDPDGMSFDQ